MLGCDGNGFSKYVLFYCLPRINLPGLFAQRLDLLASFKATCFLLAAAGIVDVIKHPFYFINVRCCYRACNPSLSTPPCPHARTHALPLRCPVTGLPDCQAMISFIVNFFLNFGFAWASMSNWGKR